MAKCSSPYRELKKTKKIRAKVFKKNDYSISSSSISDYGSSISSDSDIDEIKRPDECKEMKNLDNIVTNNIKNMNQCGDVIEYETKFGTNRHPPPVVTVRLIVGKNHMETIISGLPCL